MLEGENQLEHLRCRDDMKQDTDIFKNPTPILKKSLEQYFYDANQERTEEALESMKQKEFFYSTACEETVIRHEISCLDGKLVEARNALKYDRRRMQERWDTAAEKNKLIFDHIPEFNGYYKDLFVRRERFIKDFSEKQAQILSKEREIRMRQKEVDRLSDLQTEVDKRLEKFEVFKIYLDRVKLDSHGEYNDLKEIMDRFGILNDARDTLMEKNDSFRSTVSRKQKALERDVIIKSNEVLAYRNYLSELMEYDTTLRERVFRLEDSLLRIKTTAATRTLIIGQIKMAVHNLYILICTSLQRKVTLDADDTLGQLVDVRISIREMSRLGHDIKRMLKAAHLTAKAEIALQKKLKKIQEEKDKRLEKLGKKAQLDCRALFGLPPLKAKPMEVERLLQQATGTGPAAAPGQSGSEGNGHSHSHKEK